MFLKSKSVFKNLGSMTTSKKPSKSDTGTEKDTSTLNSIFINKNNILNPLTSNKKSTILNPTMGSKSVFTLNKNNNINNLNRQRRKINFEETTFSRPLKNASLINSDPKYSKLPKISSKDTDGIIGEKKTDVMTQKKLDNGLKINRFLSTGRINRKMNSFSPGTKIAQDNTKLQPEIKAF